MLRSYVGNCFTGLCHEICKKMVPDLANWKLLYLKKVAAEWMRFTFSPQKLNEISFQLYIFLKICTCRIVLWVIDLLFCLHFVGAGGGSDSTRPGLNLVLV